MRFYLGTPAPGWLRDSLVPLFVSRRRLERYKTFPRARTGWALDSGGFTELDRHGGWRMGAREYAGFVRRALEECGNLDWAAPQDWMCEPWMLERTGLDVEEHQRRTVDNLIELRFIAPELPIIPVLQGYTLDGYLRCVERYQRAGVELQREPLVGLGTVCRRQDTDETAVIVRTLVAAGLRLHGFGVKLTGLERYGDALVSADSMAWSAAGRYGDEEPEHQHEGCSPANCRGYAMAWRDRILDRIPSLLWKEAPCATV